MTEKLKQALLARFGRAPRLYIRTYGCQQNVADSERIRGLLEQSGCVWCESDEDADIIIFNTCAVREHAEDRVFGNVGNLKSRKAARPELLIVLGGCMVQQPHIAASLKSSYPYVDVVFNTNDILMLPQLLVEYMEEGRRVIHPQCENYTLNEDIPVIRDGKAYRAYIPIMYGCDNFCSYCVVPLVRGRERSRTPESVEAEFRACVEAGYKDIMLLGQNVNSYGKGLACGTDFPALLRRLNAIEGDFTIRFMTSHPKNATKELFDTIAACEKVSRHIHLPVQAGSDRILKEMNRHYDRAQYLSLIEYARKVIEDVYFTSDIIVGFPGETEEEYLETVSLLKEVGFYAIFSFIYSKREGTRAATMPDDTPHKVKADRLNALNELQRQLTEQQEQALVGTRHRALCTDILDEGHIECRLDSNAEVTVSGAGQKNEFCTVEITEIKNRRLYGKVV